MNKSYLITGGAGNLARQLTDLLVADGDRVALFDIAAPPALPYACTYVRGDLTDPKDVDEALSTHRPNVVLHMASLLSGASEQDRVAGWTVNVTAAFGLIEAALHYDVECFFFPSSLASFGGALPDPLPEDHPQWPEGLYGVTKVACERLGRYYHARHDLDFRCLRLPIVVSRFANPGAASAYASLAFVESVQNGRFTFKVNPTTAAAAVYVKDVAQAIRHFVHASRETLSRCVYNIHSISPSATDLAACITKRLPHVRIEFDPDPAIATLIESWPRVIKDDSARRDWGWSPIYDLNTMADDIIADLQNGSA